MINPGSLDEADLLPASEMLKSMASWTLFTHQKPDGDAAGSTSALFEAGALTGHRVSWFGQDPDMPPAYSFLSHAAEYRPCKNFAFNDPDMLYVFLDCSNERRSLPGLETETENLNVKILNIDHHEDNSRFGTVNCVDPSSSSTAELTFRILKAGGWPLTKKIAESLYTGIWTDTGGFAFSSTTARTHRLAAELLELGVDAGLMTDLITQTRTPEAAALWSRVLSHVKIFGPENVFASSWLSQEDFNETRALPSDTEGMPASLMKLKGVRLACLLTETKPGEVKASFRSREGIFGAADIARSLGGGGHPRAAGATLTGPLEDLLRDTARLLEQRYAEWTASR